MRRLGPHFVVVITVLVTGLGACGRPAATVGRPAAAAAPAGTATIVRVVDGDTLKVNVGGHNDRVRLIGIDTPESVKPNTPVQCFALEASARTKALLHQGEVIRLVRDAEARDRYGRLLAYVYRQRDGLFVNLALVKDGYAAPYTFPPNVAHVDEFVTAGRQAREANRGLWGKCGGPHEPAK
jgi:micrococcal nuclease